MVQLCSRTQAWDVYYESRVNFLYAIVLTTSDPAMTLERLAAREPRIRNEWDQRQALRILAAAGDDGFVAARQHVLRLLGTRRYQRELTHASWYAGEEGFHFALDRLHLFDEYDKPWLLNDAVEILGKRRAKKILRERAAVDGFNVADFVEKREIPKTVEEPEIEDPVEHFMAAPRPVYGLRGRFSEAQHAAFSCIVETDPDPARALRAIDAFYIGSETGVAPSTLLRRLDEADDRKAKNRWLRRIREVRAECFRDRGLQLLKSRDPWDIRDALDLLQSSLLPRDWPEIEEALRRHGKRECLGHDPAVFVQDAWRTPPLSTIRVVHDINPCDYCREKLAKALHRRRGLSTEALMALALDSNGVNRGFAQRILARTG